MKIKIFFYLISILVILSFPLGCNSTQDQAPSAPAPELKPPAEDNDKTAVFAILAPDVAFDSEKFNHWTTLKKTKGNVHVFADKANLPVFANLKGVKHSATREQLAEKMAETLAPLQVDRLIIFIYVHGASSGNWCYESQNQCHLTEDMLIDALKIQAKLEHQRLKHVLIIPLSCFNKPTMDRFGTKTRDIRWPFAISYIRQKSTEACGTQSPGETLLENLYTPFELLTAPKISSFLSLNSVRSFVDFSNRYTAFDFLKYDVISPVDIVLSDFGFDLGVRIMLYENISPARSLPENTTMRQILEKSSLDKKFYNYVAEIEFRLEDYTQVNMKTNGDLSMIIKKDNINNKNYIGMNVILRPLLFGERSILKH